MDNRAIRIVRVVAGALFPGYAPENYVRELFPGYEPENDVGRCRRSRSCERPSLPTR